MFSLAAFSSFSRAFRAVEKSVRACVLMMIFVTCPFPPTPNLKYCNGEQQKRDRKPFHIAKESLCPFLFVRFRVSLSVLFRSLRKRRSFVTVKEDLIAKRERFEVKNCFRSGIHAELGIHSSGTRRGTNRVASNVSFANVWSTGSALPIRVVPSSSFSSRVKSTPRGVYRYYMQRTKAFQKSRYEKKTNIFTSLVL